MQFEEIYRQYFKRILAYCVFRSRNMAAGEDICAKVWLKVFEKLHTYDSEKGVLSQWLFAIAQNEVNMYYKLYHIKHFFSLGPAEDYLAAENDIVDKALETRLTAKAVLEALKTLNPREQNIVTLKFYSGLNNRQIAALTKLSESNVGTILNRTMQKLKPLLEKEGV